MHRNSKYEEQLTRRIVDLWVGQQQTAESVQGINNPVLKANSQGICSQAAQRYQANGSHCEAMAVLACPKPIP
ncbi:hypothetical protein TNCV_5040931 [Trichonephila clavipes]|nr:hypothetical protein TNCV_5040931 [Trichonephila clavipes]